MIDRDGNLIAGNKTVKQAANAGIDMATPPFTRTYRAVERKACLMRRERFSYILRPWLIPIASGHSRVKLKIR